MRCAATLGALFVAGTLVCVQAQTSPAQPQDPTAQSPANPAPRVQQSPNAKHSDEQTSPGTASGTSSHALHSKARPFMGTVVQGNTGLVLRAGDLEYKLDDQDQARDHTGKNVKIMGTLDKQTNTIHVQSIENSPM